ncbi:unnamed protein product [Prunus armeniaca]
MPVPWGVGNFSSNICVEMKTFIWAMAGHPRMSLKAVGQSIMRKGVVTVTHWGATPIEIKR